MELREVLNERGKAYGSFEEYARLASAMKEIARSSPSWHKCEPYMKESIDNIIGKLCRILNGDPALNLDSFVDIAGYSQLSADAFNNKLQQEKT